MPHSLEPLKNIPKRADAFVSSVTAGNENLRARLYALGRFELQRTIWVAEESCKELNQLQHDDLRIVGTLVQMVRRADWFICLLGASTHGDPIAIDQGATAVSHFEIEFFQAVMLDKPVVIFHRPGLEPGVRLAAMLDLLRRVSPSFQEHREADDAKVLIEVKRLLGGWKTAFRRWVPIRPNLRRRLMDRFASRREEAVSSSNLRPAISFLDDAFEVRADPPRLPFVDALLAEAKGTTSVQDRLTLMWLAIRELMPAPPSTVCPPELLKRWNVVLRTWNGAACWFGLHGHLFMGALATLKLLERTREAIRSLGGLGLPLEETETPHGAFASAYYSLAKLTQDEVERARLADVALQCANAAFTEAQSSEIGLLSVRGSIHLLRGDLDAAEKDFLHALDQVDVEMSDIAARALALADLGGLNIFQHGRAAEGRRRLREAIRLAKASGDAGTIVRVRRRLARAYLWCNPLRAVWHLFQGNHLAGKKKMYDQVRWWPG